MTPTLVVVVAAIGAVGAADDVHGAYGARVLFLADADTDLAARVRDQLVADGYDVIRRDEHELIDVVGAARALSASAIVEIHDARLDVWIDPGRAPVEHAVVDGAGLDRDVVAVRTAELLRARLAASRAPAAAPPAAAPAAATVAAAPAPNVPVDVDGTAGLRGQLAVGGLPAMLGVDASLGVRIADRVLVGVTATLPTFAAHVENADGSADVTLAGLALGAGARFPAGDALALTGRLAVGGVWLHGSGRALRGSGAHDGDLVVGDVDAQAGVRWRFAPPLALLLAADAGVLLPTPTLVVGAARVPCGPVHAGVVVGVAFDAGDPP